MRIPNWVVHLESAGSNAKVSSQNAYDTYDTYGIWADIDTTKGAWNDRLPDGASMGSMYNMDLGLIKSDVTQRVSLTVSNVDPIGWQNFGINVYSGTNQMHSQNAYVQTDTLCCDANGNPVPIYSRINTNLADMLHYGYWNFGYLPGDDNSEVQEDNPFNAHITYVTHGDDSTVTFTALAGEVYAILLGGYSGEGVFSA